MACIEFLRRSTNHPGIVFVIGSIRTPLALQDKVKHYSDLLNFPDIPRGAPSALMHNALGEQQSSPAFLPISLCHKGSLCLKDPGLGRPASTIFPMPDYQFSPEFVRRTQSKSCICNLSGYSRSQR